MKLSLLFLFVSFLSFSQTKATVYFDTDASETELPEFTIEPKDSLQVIKWMYAHCDTSGSEGYNNQLAQRRYDFVFNELKRRGYKFSPDFVDSSTIHGELSAQRATNYLAKEWRRVDIQFMKSEPLSEVANIQTESQVHQGYAPEPLYEEEEKKTTEALSRAAVANFIEEDTEESLEFDLTILFVNASTRALEESKPQMYELLEIMQNNPSLHATIHGHVCCQPHYVISEGRARTVAIFLRENGIPANRLDYVGHSNTQPKVWPEVTDEDRKLNRRVTVEFSKLEE